MQNRVASTIVSPVILSRLTNIAIPQLRSMARKRLKAAFAQIIEKYSNVPNAETDIVDLNYSR